MFSVALQENHFVIFALPAWITVYNYTILRINMNAPSHHHYRQRKHTWIPFSAHSMIVKDSRVLRIMRNEAGLLTQFYNTPSWSSMMLRVKLTILIHSRHLPLTTQVQYLTRSRSLFSNLHPSSLLEANAYHLAHSRHSWYLLAAFLTRPPWQCPLWIYELSELPEHEHISLMSAVPRQCLDTRPTVAERCRIKVKFS